MNLTSQLGEKTKNYTATKHNHRVQPQLWANKHIPMRAWHIARTRDYFGLLVTLDLAFFSRFAFQIIDIIIVIIYIFYLN